MTLDAISWNMIAGGFGMFMFGIKFMGDGLKSVAGDKLREYIDKYTSNPVLALLIGLIITVVIQSSSATTAITIGLVRAGLMTLEQAAGIVMGANIGTTITAFLIGLKLDAYSLYFVFIGAMIIVFGKRKKLKYIGEIVFGFGLLFFGLSIMGDSLKELKDLPQFTEIAYSMSVNPLLGLFTSTIMTAIIQSSSGAIGVLQKMYEAGGIEFIAVLPFIFGSNIGTTITGVLAAIGGSLAARRTAGVHTMFNIVGTAIGMLLLVPYTNFVLYLTSKYNISPMMQIAIAHIIFNVATTIVFFPLLKQMCALIRKIIPGDEPERIDIKIDDLDERLAHTLPAAALELSEKALVKMANAVDHMLDDTKSFLINTGTSEDKEIIDQSESLINNFDRKITDYLIIISNQDLTESDTAELNLHLKAVKNLERIGDLSMNVTEFIEMVYEDKGTFTKEAIEELSSMFDLLKHMLNRSVQIFTTKKYNLFTSLQEDENYLDGLEFNARQAHFKRVANKECDSTVAGSVYCDILSNLERMGDHCLNIAKNAVSYLNIEATTDTDTDDTDKAEEK